MSGVGYVVLVVGLKIWINGRKSNIARKYEKDIRDLKRQLKTLQHRPLIVNIKSKK
jgi:hypothetical protein